MNARTLVVLIVLLAASASVSAVNSPDNAVVPAPVKTLIPADNTTRTVERASADMQQKLKDSVDEYNAFCEEMQKEKIPLNTRLNQTEDNLTRARRDYEAASSKLDNGKLELNNLRTDNKTRREEISYVSGLLQDYTRKIESHLHLAEADRYRQPLEAAGKAAENSGLSEEEVVKAQMALLDASIDRLQDALGGVRFEGDAVNEAGAVKSGAFVLVGPTAIFRSNDGLDVGTAEKRGSPTPTVVPFWDPADTQAAAALATARSGFYPFDPTRYNAHKVGATRDTLWGHIKKGGPIMVPIIALGLAALSVALYKWGRLSFVRKPSQRQIAELMQAVARQDGAEALRKAKAIKGPIGSMLVVGVEHIKESRDLVEEVMYEAVLTTRHKLQSLLPFIATSATCAPLLGLLGTVSGIISTFKMMTAFGSGDAKTLSGGISEALIGTEFGLYVAIPSLLLHAFLSRKARGILDQMEKTAVALINQLGKTPHEEGDETPESKPAQPQAAASAAPTDAADPGVAGAAGPVPAG